METDRELYPSQEQRIQFGRTLTLWLKRCAWTHDTPMLWGKAAGFSAPKDSTFNRLQNAKIAQPLPLTFIQLGNCNQRLAASDWGTIPDIDLRQRVQAAQPVLHDDGMPWSASDFFAHFIGEQAAPEWAQQPDPISDADAKAFGLTLQEAFTAVAKAQMLSPAAAWKALEPHCNSLSKAQRETFREVLAGWHEYNAEEVADLGPIGSTVAEVALARWEKAG